MGKQMGVAQYKGKYVLEMSGIELKGLLITLIEDWTEAELRLLVNKIANIHFAKNRGELITGDRI